MWRTVRCVYVGLKATHIETLYRMATLTSRVCVCVGLFVYRIASTDNNIRKTQKPTKFYQQNKMDRKY